MPSAVKVPTLVRPVLWTANGSRLLLSERPCVQIRLPGTLLPTTQVRQAIKVPTLPERKGGLEQSRLLGQQAKATWHLADPSGVKRPYGRRPLQGQHEQESHLPSEECPKCVPRSFLSKVRIRIPRPCRTGKGPGTV